MSPKDGARLAVKGVEVSMFASGALSSGVGALLLFGLAVLFGSALYGVLSFSPEKAAAVRVAESPNSADDISQHLYIGLRPARRIRSSRIDRSVFYLFQNVGMGLFGLEVIINPIPSTNVPLSTQGHYGLGVALLTGSFIALSSSLLGLRWRNFSLIGSISRNPFTDELGDDVRLPYRLGTCGLMSIGAAMASYAQAIIEDSSSRLFGTLGGCLSITTALSCLTLGGMFIWRSRVYASELNRLVIDQVRREESL